MTDQDDIILRLPIVLQKTGLSRSTLYRKVGDGTFRRQIKMGQRCAGWRSSAIHAWLRSPVFYSMEDPPSPG